jgi:nitrite reductase/ring-hydroxylating ferredoxin subunit
MAKKIKWHKIAHTTDELFGKNKQPVLVNAGGKKICIAMAGTKLFGCAAKCPHAGGHMHEGWVDAQGNIVCPLHRYKFSLANGRNTSGEGYYLKTYVVEERENGIFVGIEEGWLF